MPNSRIQVELDFILQAGTRQILNFAQNPRQSQRVQGTKLNWRGEAPHRKVYTGSTGHRTYFLNRCPIGGGHPTSKQASSSLWNCQKKMGCGGWVGGFMRIMPRCGSILQAEPCQILRLAEKPRWSRMWQKYKTSWG